MKNWITRNKWTIAGIGSGALIGYLYYLFIGCSNGSCVISSKPLNSIIYFSVTGALFSNLFKTNKDGNSKQQ